MVSILFIEDDPAVAEAITLGLNRLGHDVSHRPPDGNGDFDDAWVHGPRPTRPRAAGCRRLRDLRRIRTRSSIPIIILTARSDDIDTVAGLEAGADDYVVKPASPRVLDARIKAVVRRSAPATTRPDATPGAETFGDLELDRSSLQVRKAGMLLTLTPPTELRLILALTENPRTGPEPPTVVVRSLGPGVSG